MSKMSEKSNANAGVGDEVAATSLSSSTAIELKEERKLSNISIPSIPSLASVSVATNGPSNNSFDLSGKIIVKAQLDDDIRVVPIHNDEITYDELLLMMQRIFKGDLKPEDDVVVKYKDEDGDLVTIIDTADLSLAIQSSRVLKLKLLPKKKEEPAKDKKIADVPVNLIRRELKELRDRANHLLDYLDQQEPDKIISRVSGSFSVGSQRGRRDSVGININGVDSPMDSKPATVPIVLGAMPRATPSPVPVKEFDPLGQQQQQQKQLDQEEGSDQPPVTVNGGPGPTPRGPPPPGPQQHQQQQPQQATSSKQGMDHQPPPTITMVLGPQAQQQSQTSRYPATVPQSQSMPSMAGSSGGAAMSHGMMNQQQQLPQPPSPQLTQSQQPPAHSQPGAYPPAPSGGGYQQYGVSFGAPPAPASAPTHASSYGTGGPRIMTAYPGPGPQPSRPTTASYGTGGSDSSVVGGGYSPMPPTSSTMPMSTMMSAHSGPSTAPAAGPVPQQHYAPPAQQYNPVAMSPAMPSSYNPPQRAPPPPSAGGMMGSNPYSRSAVPPPPQVQTYRPQ